MYNCLSFDEPLEQPLFSHMHMSQSMNFVNPMFNSTNKFVYVKQNVTCYSKPEPIKVLVNPNFNKKVFVNPNFNGNKNVAPPFPLPKIHVNPNVQKIKVGIDGSKNIKKIHVNPNVLRNIPTSTSDAAMNSTSTKDSIVKSGQEKELSRTIISTRTKLVRTPVKNTSEVKIKKRRSSIRSKFRIIKSSLLENRDKGMKSKYESTKSYHKYAYCIKNTKFPKNKFKLDNRSVKMGEASPRNKKYVYINRFLNISDIARNSLLKQNRNKLIAINIYKKSPNSLKKSLNPYKKTNVSKIQENAISKSKYKLKKKSLNMSLTNHQSSSKQMKTSLPKRKSIVRNTSKLRICHIPCPYYRKFGRCKGKENGKCYRKHDPDQIALCTKFLQGACVDKKCLLSHNVSPEKMPTCKFYLEGSCSRDDCPYLHVRISPKADICKDFLEGFCKKAAECNKRHQFLCPDYEKNGNCLKPRCSYPHGTMVRKYSVFSKNNFAKKSSTDTKRENAVVSITERTKSKNLISCESSLKPRYYIGQNNLDGEPQSHISDAPEDNFVVEKNDQKCGIKNRPQLGTLPSFIAFENT